MERHLATLWEHVADAVPDATAVVQGDLRLTYRELDDRAARLAGALQAAGLGTGSKVAQYLYNSPAYVESYAAALKIRGVPVNVNYRYLDDELLYLLENSEAEALVFHASLGDRVARVAERATGVKLLLEVDDLDSGDERIAVAGAQSYEDAVRSAAPAARIERDPKDVLLLYTGGTTGMPKGVMTKNGSAVDGAITTIASVTGVPAASGPDAVPELVRSFVADQGQFVTMPACPLMHGTGMAALAPTLGGGGKLVLLAGRGLDIDELWSTVEREGVNSLVIVGDAFARPMLRGLREGPSRELDCVKFVFSAGAMFSAEVREGLLEHLPGAAIIDNIAASEGGMGMAVSTKGNIVPTGSFLPNPGVKLFTEDGIEVEPGSDEIGMVAVPGSIPEGYYHDADKTARTFREFGGVRYAIPGDWGTIGADGILTLLGRGSQCINTGGEKVFPEEVEEVLKVHPSVEDALVFGLPDERFGQRIAAVVSLAPGAEPVEDPKEIVDAVRTRISSYKLPRDVVVVDTVPRAANGKADYPRARELFEIASAPRQ
ncbi:MAG TPA: AMP-binding protein [Acidimicrobiales bacterium]|nr:AMP-binding protein [Acidimicrobiales bacterium]